MPEFCVWDFSGLLWGERLFYNCYRMTICLSLAGRDYVEYEGVGRKARGAQ